MHFIVWNKCGGRVIYVVGDFKMWWKIDTINVAGELYIYQGINKCSGVLIQIHWVMNQ